MLAWHAVTGLGDQGSSAGSANQISHSRTLTKTTYHFCYHEGVLHKHILYIKSVLNPAQVRRLVPTAPEGASSKHKYLERPGLLVCKRRLFKRPDQGL